MSGKSAAKKPATETATAAKKTTPRVSTAKHRTKVQEPSAPVVQAAAGNPSEVIAAIAYGYWESRGCQGGDPVEDWLRAEKEFFAEKAASAAA